MAGSWDRAYTRRQAIGVGAAGVGAFYLAACGGDSGSSGGRDVSVVFDFEYAGKPGSMKRYWETLRDRLERSDVDARLSDLSFVNYANTQARLQSNHAARSGPTLETWYPNWLTYEFIVQDALTPVEDHVRAGATDDWLFAQRIDGKYWGAPFYAEQALLIANKRHLAKAGVDIGERLESWDAFMDACARIKRSGELPVMIGAADGYACDKWSLASSMEYMNSVKQLPLNLLGELSVDEPVVSAWMEYFNQLSRDGYVNDDVVKITEQQSLDRFLDGEGAFAMLYPGIIFDKDPEQFRVVGYWNGPGRYAAPIAVSGNLLLMTSYGENKEAAGRILDFMQEPEQLQLFSRITGELPCNRNFDPSELGELERTAWRLMTNPGEGKIVTWPRDRMPVVGADVTWELGPRAFAGESPAALRAAYQRRMERYREQNSAQIDEYKKYVDTIEG
ncbi:MAG TPA: ABC transporter substrate-binding protein [Thermoleophilaceae bacterium]|nr:ABC transporter substrate-binding protein [Thermoleophilaceae bacterium]